MFKNIIIIMVNVVMCITYSLTFMLTDYNHIGFIQFLEPRIIGTKHQFIGYKISHITHCKRRSRREA